MPALPRNGGDVSVVGNRIKGAASIIQLEKDKTKGKCRRWQLRLLIGRDLTTGEYLCKTRVVRGAYFEAQRELRAFIEEVGNCRV